MRRIFPALLALPFLAVGSLAQQTPAQREATTTLARPDVKAEAKPDIRVEVHKPTLYRKILKSIVYVRTPSGSGSAWVLDASKRLIVTNFHVVADDDNKVHSEVRVYFPAFRNGKLIAERSYYHSNARRLEVRGKVLDANKTVDLAIVEVDELPEDMVALKLAKESIDPSERVHSVGNPGTSGALWGYTFGTVRAVYRHSWRTKVGYHTAKVVETQSPTNPGDSGGPLVNDAGELVGVTQGGAKEGHLVSWFIDVEEVRDYVATVNRKLSASRE